MSSLYDLLLVAHSALRWGVLGSCLCLLVHASFRALSSHEGSPADTLLARIFVGFVDLQLTVGLALYFALSPLAALARSDLAIAWSHPTLRFFGFLHPFLAITSFVVAHAMSVAARRAQKASARHLRLAVGSGLCLFVYLLMIPWPFLDYGRPWLRGVSP